MTGSGLTMCSRSGQYNYNIRWSALEQSIQCVHAPRVFVAQQYFNQISHVLEKACNVNAVIIEMTILS